MTLTYMHDTYHILVLKGHHSYKVGESLRSWTSIPPRRATWIGDSIPEHGHAYCG